MPTPDDFTGERFLPDCTGEIWAEHWHRYLFAARYVTGRDVLDAACGEGYGASWLARHARTVTGLDVDAPTVVTARAKYTAPELRFEVGSVAAMPFADASFDCVVSFETLEHLAEQEAMLTEIRRVLRPDGLLIISTPNRVEYSENRDFHNEFHVRELYEDEFRALLFRHFGAQRWYGQRLVFNSAIWPLPAAAAATSSKAMQTEWIAVDAEERKLPAPMYFLALAAADETLLPGPAALTLLADPDDAMYREYTQTVGRASRLEKLVDDREKIVVERDRELLLCDGRMQHLEALIAERETIVTERDLQLSALADRAGTMERLIAERERLVVERDGQIQAANALLAELERRIAERERLVALRDGELAALNARAESAEMIVDQRDGQLAATNKRLTECESIIVERDGQLTAANATIATAERLIGERERIIVERDAQLAAVNARMAAAESVIALREREISGRDERLAAQAARIATLEGEAAQREQLLQERDRQLVLRAEVVDTLNKTVHDLRQEVARRAGWRWWLALPFLRIRWKFSAPNDAANQGGS